MVTNPNNRGPGIARYLLGMGPMPPLFPEELAITQLHGALDSGIFSQLWNGEAPLQLTQAGLVHPQAIAPVVEENRNHQPADSQYITIDCSFYVCLSTCNHWQYHRKPTT
jgi:hypothetical protein